MTMLEFTIQQIKKFIKHKRFRAWLMILGICFALICFEEVVDDVFHDPQEGDYEAQTFDRSISETAKAWRTPALNQVMTDLTALGSVSVIVTLFVIFMSLLISFRDLKGIAFVSFVLAGAGLWPTLLKLYFNRGRPADTEWLAQVNDLSFPSGHSFGAAAAYIGFAYYASLYAKNWRHEGFFYILGALLAAIVGLSRIYLGVHYPTDVLAGLSGGVAWGLFASAVYELFFRRPRENSK